MKIFVVGVSLASLSAVSLLIWFYNKTNSKRKQRLEIKIPNSAMGYVIGRCGGTLKNIETQSKARIKFMPTDATSVYTTCVIKGDLNSVQLAAGVIDKIIENYAEGEDIEETNKFDFHVSDEILLSDISCVVETLFGGRLNHGNDFNEPAETPKTEEVNDFICRHTQKLYSPGGDGLIPVYVSAVYNPEKFWIQVIKTKEHADLDRLTLNMLDYYNSNPDYSLPPPFSDIKRGYLCAVFFEDDNRWYRAKVCVVSKNNQNVLDTLVDLYLLDFGESIYEKVGNLRAIPSEFLNLNFQAIECGLSNVKSIEENWQEEAIQCFENAVHVGQWYTLMARIDFHEEGYRPYLTLIDNNGETPVNISEKLVSMGFAELLDV